MVDAQGRAIAAGGLDRWLSRLVPASVRGTVTVAVVSDARVRRLNRDYRGRDYATDVLSFPAADVQPPAAFRSPRTPRALGDIVIATGVSRRQASDHGHPHRTELRVLALHGLLHLLGYDHDAADDGGRMARVERRWRRRGGLTASLIERATDDRGEAAARSGDADGTPSAARRRSMSGGPRSTPAEGARSRPEKGPSANRAEAARRRIAAPADARLPGEGPRSNQ